MGTTRRKFSREFKLEAVRMVTEGGHSMDHVLRLMRVYRELVTDSALRREQKRREAVKLERLARRLMEWDGVSEELPENSLKH